MGYGIVNTGFPVRSEAFDPAGSAAATQANLAVHVADKNNPHGVSPGQIGAAAASHTHDASQITAGTLAGAVLANAAAAADVGSSQVRNIHAGTGDLTAGSSALASGQIYLVYE